MEHEEITHESFGQISFSRRNGTANFYGSELTQQHYVHMTVTGSVLQRNLTDDRYFTRGPSLIELRMTAGQFAEMITSMNRGGGSCCTIEVVQGKQVAKLPETESRKELVHRKFKDRMAEFAERLRQRQAEAKEIVKKKTLSKEDVRQLSLHLDYLTMEVTQNIPYFAECFQETMDDAVLEAKMEIENALQHKVNMLGLSAIAAQNKLLNETKPE